MKKKVVVGMSGGVDSSVAAALLKEKGYEVIGVYMNVYSGKEQENNGIICYGQKEGNLKIAKKTAEILNIPLFVVDVEGEFKKKVIDYFINGYLEGKTPNPCIMCNRYIKFGILLEKLKKLDINFDYFSTGHYAKVKYNGKRYIIQKGKDKEKDQSYFLFLLTQKQLSKVVFPLGDFKKTEVREIARKYKFPSYERDESQDFISGTPSFFDNEKEIEIVDKRGNVLGKNKGIFYYTIGQRRGLGIAKGMPLYVIGIDAKKKGIIVGEKKDVYKKYLIAGDLNFVSIDKIEYGMKVKGKIRYKSPLSTAYVFPYKNDKIIVRFEKEQWAITPGQAVVLYKGSTLLFGGIIEKGVSHEEITLYIKK